MSTPPRSYSDDWLTNGTVEYNGFPNNSFVDSIASPSGTYQPR